MRKAFAIARTTWREVVRQPAIWVVTALTSVMILLFRYFTLFALGQEHSMIREMALASMTLAGLLVAVLGASTVLAEEEEKRTLLTLLSKPIGRGQLILGKFVGIALAVLLVFVPLTLVYLGAVCWSEWITPGGLIGAKDVPPFATQITAFLKYNAWNLVKASSLAYAEVLVLAAVSIAISTRLPMIVNIILTVGVFVLGHQADSLLAQMYPKAADGTLLIQQTDQLGFFGVLVHHPLLGAAKIVHGIVPDLAKFNAGDAVAASQSVPGWYVAAAAGYAMLYVAFALLLAQALFVRREFA